MADRQRGNYKDVTLLSKRQIRRIVTRDVATTSLFISTDDKSKENEVVVERLATSGNYDGNGNDDREDDDYDAISNNSSTSSTDQMSHQLCLLEDVEEVEENLNVRSDTTEASFALKLAKWANDVNLPHVHLNKLLNVLKDVQSLEELRKLPKDARTLLHTPSSIMKRVVPPGEYVHFGFRRAIQSVLSRTQSPTKNERNILKFGINIDGLPISKSSTKSVWPILASLLSSKDVVIVGVYVGDKKPNNSNQFLEDFVKEAEYLCEHGVEYDGNFFSVDIAMLVCDSPAKSFVLNCKGHSGYSSCTKCHINGENIKQRICFPGVKEFSLRTDAEIRCQVDEDFHKEESSAFCRIPHFNMVEDVVIDYMHVICLGIMKRLLNAWLTGDLKNRIGHKASEKISQRLLQLRVHVPLDFARKPRSLQFLAMWKATEFRQFLLYTGVLALKDVLDPDIYQHFLTLHVAVRILCCRETLLSHGDYAQSLLVHFVHHFEKFYGSEFVSHNCHSLLHIVNDCKKFGVLDNFSAFKFENYMQQIKKMLRKSDNILGQLHRRYIEREMQFSKVGKIEGNVHAEEFKPLVNSNQGEAPCSDLQYESVSCGSIVLNSTSLKERCCGLSDGSVIELESVSLCNDTNKFFALGRKYERKESFYTLPCDSSVVGIYVIFDLSKKRKRWPLSSIKKKYVKLPLPECPGKFVVLSLMHLEA